MKKNVIITLLLFIGFGNLNSQVLSKGLYVDKFKQILGNVQKEDSLLNYAQAKGFNYLALYDLWPIHVGASLTNTTTALPLANFINKAKTLHGILSVGAIGENFWFFKNVIHLYNQQHPNPNHKFEIYNLEFEFWVPTSVNAGGVYCTTYLQPGGFTCDTSGGFKFFKRELRQIDSLANTIGVISETYIGWPNAPQARSIVSTCDRVLVHAYVANESTTYNYTKPRLADLASGVTPAKLIPIFSAEPTFMGPWVLLNSPLQAYTNYNVNFTNETALWKSNVSILGYQWFAYSFMPYNLATSINTIEKQDQTMIISPNPCSEQFKVSGQCHQDVMIYNSLGQAVKTVQLNSENNYSIEISDLENGIYYLTSSQTKSKKKIVILK